MGESKPISFRVAKDVLDALEAEGKSPTQIAKAAIEREALLAKRRRAWRHIVENPLPGTYDGDVVEHVRQDRDAR